MKETAIHHPYGHQPQLVQPQDHPRVSAVVAGVTDLLNSHPDVDQKLPHGCGLAGYNDYAIEIGLLVRALLECTARARRCAMHIRPGFSDTPCCSIALMQISSNLHTNLQPCVSCA